MTMEEVVEVVEKLVKVAGKVVGAVKECSAIAMSMQLILHAAAHHVAFLCE